MSMVKNYYVIAGYDLTGMTTDKYKDWKWTDEGEQYTCNQSKGHIQLFDDLMSGEHLYLGYILASGDEYDFDTVKFGVEDVTVFRQGVNNKLVKLINAEVISNDVLFKKATKYQVIVFEECR